ncbi:phage tail sheath family protein [Streptomyces sioyaensis]|uniref:Phage tail sheath family protein n=1 Tax=Streptomyces sioyaensis TaxID=67364 RepID=A0A4Q1QSU5_9ACTN|nr:phage tail sheath C-terminal domain-containing protein [Streptomyces sioyaensis]RXS60003.1 phage tail sheath family protein [Streptomyces sioyaensis]
MPVNLTYPGVYIDEVKSSVRTITGVPTSVAAFVGYAPRGPVDRPVHVTSWADYETVFGGLQMNSPMSYAVYQFFLNGGSDAEIVRVVKADPKQRNTVRVPIAGSQRRQLPSGSSPPPAKSTGRSKPAAEGEAENSPAGEEGGEAGTPAADAPAAKQAASARSASSTGQPFELLAASPGRWAERLEVTVDYDVAKPEKDGAAAAPSSAKPVFNLVIKDNGNGLTETYRNVTTDPDSPRSLDHQLASSQLVRLDPDQANRLADVLPPETTGQARPLGGDADDRPSSIADYTGSEAQKTGVHQLLKTDIFNVLCLPDCEWLQQNNQNLTDLLTQSAALCADRRAIFLVDPPAAWTAPENGEAVSVPQLVDRVKSTPVLEGDLAKNAAVYFPRVLAPDPLRGGALRPFPPSGVMAGVLARTDVQRGVWKAPAGTDASLNGVVDLEVPLTDGNIGQLNPVGVNCLRRLPAAGPVAWGARTLRGADRLADEWKYLPVRRLALFIEESLFRGTQWVVFEPNDEPLWASVRLNIGAFMNTLFRAGAFQGRTPQEAYLVKCDKENNPQNDIDRGIVNIQVGFAPLKPSEFVIVHIQQLAGQIQV